MTDRTGTASPLADVDYPESDGEPMAETDLHRDEMVALIEGLKGRYETRPDVYVAGNLFLYYERGNPSAVFAPDTMVVFGVEKRQRRTYKLWEERHAPAFVLEVSSKKTSTEDEGNKMVVCRRLGVREYFLFDPEGDYLEPRLQGHRLVRGQYRAISPEADGSLASETLGLRFHADGPSLRAIDSKTGEPILRPEEERRARVAEARRADEEARRADEEARRADEEARRADEEARRRERYAARLRELGADPDDLD